MTGKTPILQPTKVRQGKIEAAVQPEPVLTLDEDGMVFRYMSSGNLYPVRIMCARCRRFVHVRALLEPPEGMDPHSVPGPHRRLYMRPYCSRCGNRLPFDTLDELDMSQRPQPRKRPTS